MILDAQTRLAPAQPITTGTQLSANTYDLGLARDIGRGLDLRVKVVVTTTFAGGTSLQVYVVEDTAASLASATVIVGGPVVPEAAMTMGATVLDIALPKVTKRYLGLQFVSVGTHAAGAVEGSILFDTDSNVTFAAITGF
jgi:hypothetical protein